MSFFFFDPSQADQQAIDEHFMSLALKEAGKAFDHDEVPIGCVITHKNQVIAKAYNQVEQLNDATAHAEMLAITMAFTALSSWRLLDCVLYTTLEPCPMCAGAIQLARIPTVVFAAHDPKKGACGSLLNILNDARFNHTATLRSGILAEPANLLLKNFFQHIRQSAKPKETLL